MAAQQPSDDLAKLLRWEEAGATWEVFARSTDAVTISLCTCDGGEEVDRYTSAEADLLAYVKG
jgi:hypothetical protein